MAKMRGQPLRENVETEINLGLAAYIPESYIADSRERLRYYKALSSAPDAVAQRDVEFELRDRFGAVPPELETFFSVLGFKRHLASWGVNKADIMEDRVRLHFDQNHASLDPARVVAWVQASKGRAKLQPPAGIELALTGKDTPEKLANAYAELLPVVAGKS